MVEKIDAKEFEDMIAKAALRSSDVRAVDWSFKIISRYVGGISYNHTDPGLQCIVEQCEDDKDWYEAHRFLTLHCDPVNSNTSHTRMKDIMKLGRRKVSTNPTTAIDDFLATVCDIKKRLGDYAKIVPALPGARRAHGSHA